MVLPLSSAVKARTRRAASGSLACSRVAKASIWATCEGSCRSAWASSAWRVASSSAARLATTYGVSAGTKASGAFLSLCEQAASATQASPSAMKRVLDCMVFPDGGCRCAQLCPLCGLLRCKTDGHPAVRVMRRARRSARQQLGQHRHAHEYAVRHLFEDARLRAVGHLVGDLDAAVERAGVHHQAALGGAREAAVVQAVAAEVGGLVGQVGGGHALLLQAQHDRHVGARDRAVEILGEAALR